MLTPRRRNGSRRGEGLLLEGRGSTGGWTIVALAVISLLAFTGLLYVRGGSGPRLTLSGDGASDATPVPGQTPGRPSIAATSGPSGTGGSSGLGSATPEASGSPSAAVAGASSPASSSVTKTARPAATQPPLPTDTPADSSVAYRLPTSPQPATVALENGQGGCANYPAGGVLVETSFSVSAGRLTVKSPSGQKLSGRLQADGSFSVTASSPKEVWKGVLTETGGTGSYFVVNNGCTEGYETTIAFHR
jgi:hypothetical protein